MKVIRRGKVHVVENEQGKIFSITEDSKVKVNIRQLELHVVDSIAKKVIKEHYMECPMEFMGFRVKKGTIVPGNIHIVQQVEPYNEDDLLDGLLWKDNQVVKTELGQPIYEIRWYDEQEKFEPELEIDRLLLSL